MTAFKSQFQKWATIFGVGFLLTYLFQDFLWEKIWVWWFLLIVFFATAFIITFIVGLIKKDKRVIPIFFGILVVVALTEILESETFKSQKILQATLHDDASVINLTLRKNNTFELNSATVFSNQSFKGKYKLINDKIVFLDKPYDNDFIPDTITIYKDKIILRFDKDNKPITEFASYFKVTSNQLQNSR